MSLTYDVHTHIGLDQGFVLRAWWPYAATAQDLLQHMDQNHIDRAVCFPFCVASCYDPYAFADRGEIRLLPGRFPYDRENHLLVQECRRIDQDRRLRVLAMIDPSREIKAQAGNIDKLTGQIAGLKLQATVIQSFVADLLDGARVFMEMAGERDWPVLIHTSYNPNDRWSQVSDCLKVAAAYPKVRFNLAHSLRFDLTSLKQAATMANVWVDCSAHLAHCSLAVAGLAAVAPGGERPDVDYSKPDQVLIAIHDILGDRYMWGSDNPFMSWCDDGIREIHSYRDEMDVMRALPEPVRTDMLSRGPAAWLGAKS